MAKKSDFVLFALVALSIAGCAFQFFRNRGIDQALCEGEIQLNSLEESLADSRRMELLDCDTGVLKFNLFRQKVESMMRSDSASGKKPALILLTFGNKDTTKHGLKYVNDTYGHLNSRMLIDSFAQKLKNTFPEKQFVTGYRGGSNFMVYSADYGSRDELVSTLRKFVESWHDTPYHVPDGSGTVSDLVCYAVIAIQGETGEDPLQFFDAINREKESVRKQGDTACVVLPCKERQ